MVRAKGTTLKAMQFKVKQESGAITNNGGAGESSSSFRVLYYGDASAGSVPFMWESHPGTPKHATTESSLPSLTPPPAYNHFNHKYNSSMHSTTTTTLRTLFLATKTHVSAPSSKMSATSLRSLFLASSSSRALVAAAPPPPSCNSLSCSLSSTPMNKGKEENELRRRRAVVNLGVEEGGDENHGGCGGGFMKVYRMKKVKNALMSISNHSKMTKKIN